MSRNKKNSNPTSKQLGYPYINTLLKHRRPKEEVSMVEVNYHNPTGRGKGAKPVDQKKARRAKAKDGR